MLRQILTNWFNKTKPSNDAVKVNNLPKHTQVRMLVEKMANRKGRPFNALVANSISVQSIDLNIVLLIERIKHYTDIVIKEQNLTTASVLLEFKKVTLDQFFTDEEGNYISMNKMQEFIHVSIALFDAIDKVHPSNQQYILRLLNKCINSIQYVCNAIEQAQ